MSDFWYVVITFVVLFAEFWIGFYRGKRHVEKRHHMLGTILVYRLEREDRPHLFLDLDEDPDSLVDGSFVTMRVEHKKVEPI